MYLPRTITSGPRAGFRPALGIAAVLGVLLAVTLVLWARYGAAVFFEMAVAGFRACF